MPGSKYKPRTPPHFNSSVLFPTWKCFSFQDEEPITSLSLTLPSTSVDSAPHNSHDSLAERRSDMREGKSALTRGELFPIKVSIQLKFSPMRTVEQFNIELRKWQENILMRQAVSGSLLSAQLLFLFRFLLFHLSCWNVSDELYAHVCIHTRAQESIVVCKSEPPRGYFKISFSWTVQTMNSYDSVSKLCCWEGNYIHSLGNYIWWENWNCTKSL